MSHLAPFVDVSRQAIRKQVEAEWQGIDLSNKEEKLAEITEKRVDKEIGKGLQTLNYQVQTLLTTNGQLGPLYE